MGVKKAAKPPFVSALAVSTAIVTGVIAFPAPALAANSTFIDRGDCRWHAEVWSGEAETERVDTDGGCTGHSWARIKVDGSWRSWQHKERWIVIPLPSAAHPIQQSQHKTCSDCGVYTLTPTF
ncbi:hypothetical protein FHR83_004022 [Actinoplanes campanulatus]|uniref:Secreted protein n=1 Tax=Actinoplanes campanulatus TaxID=113559 RepID=A0A7W5AHR5_9ACTN|nr:hypothetical protein [Actinoplanes campanulatus]MBB3096352.1 hypothetical protein [Actinoplanes campanulatus]GGN18851.1 hypothetical protein GCM10010109_32170 [Actinoplanes campanulatus]GID38419.1 hypothetical protein Aca09nite_49250 [Actinoplanes campanulatus]